ncbi:DedA family protein [Aquibacillus koreensis]|uniref:DedA family protein n=1 Tax=Aquibacillus koreensis TaxID=279446 RepID=A0A9X4AI00_9BACI|nr:DedA family protein [Aquibacillus koreensis]MCT2537332.1 DedA family protein [Aquibacillus koreensis]MDC3418778.1 DedA family protein [Aquibacillus koreensis]
MESWLTSIINEYGYMGIMFLIAFENIFPPIPSEVILTFTGFMTTTTNLTIIGAVLSSTAGSLLGAIILYLIGFQLGIEKLEKIVDRWGRILRLTKKDLYRADRWFEKYGAWTVLFCRFIPVIRSLISIPAGITKMNIGIFLLFTTCGTLIWNVVLIYLGASVGASWEEIVEYLEIYENVVYVVLFILVIIGYLLFRGKKK